MHVSVSSGVTKGTIRQVSENMLNLLYFDDRSQIIGKGIELILEDVFAKTHERSITEFIQSQ
jgi:hypothetical protein